MISFGKGVTLKNNFKTRDLALVWLNDSEFARNKIINIYINPNNPNKSVVFNGLNFITFIPLIIGILFMGLIIYGFKYNSNKQHSTFSNNSRKPL